MNSVAIVGAGITGLTAAYRLQKYGIPVTVYEASPQTGGMIRTTSRDGFTFELGPNTIMETSPRVRALIRSVGLEQQRIQPSPDARRRYIVRGSRLHAVPQSPADAIWTRLFTLGAKLRALAEPFIPASQDDESVARFVRRRLGREFLDYAVDPLVGGIFAGDPEQLSITHAFPKLRALEQRDGSLIRGALHRKKSGPPSKASAPAFSFPGGLQTLIDALSGPLAGAIRLNTPVTDLARLREHSAVLLCTPAHQLAQLGLSCMNRIVYPPVIRLVFGFRREQVTHPLDGFGVLVPKLEPFRILGALFSSTTFSGRAPDGHVLITVYMGGARSPELATLGDAELRSIALDDLARLLGVTGQPVLEDLARIPRAIPQFNLGYGEIKRLIREVELRSPGLFLAGNYRDGIAVSDAIVSGDTSAERISAFLHHEGRIAHQSWVA